MKTRVLLVIKDITLQKYLEEYFSDIDIEINNMGHLKRPWSKIIKSSFDIIVINETFLPQPLETSIPILNQLPDNPITVLLQDGGTSTGQAKILADGADIVLNSDIPDKNIAQAIEPAIDSILQIYNERIQHEDSNSYPLSDFFSKSYHMKLIFDEIKIAINSNVPLFILGETGVGKEHLARAIHSESTRFNGPFIPVNLAAIPDQLIESELFGYEQGAFTGALRSRRGAFELAHNGTIFLDEIGEMPSNLQSKLLRVLQDYEVKPIGGEQTTKVDVRVIAATNIDIEKQIENNQFRRDLFYRLNVISVTIPPLRERKEDISLLAEKFTDMYSKKYTKKMTKLSDSALKALQDYSWPGNIRELMNIIERAVILCNNSIISVKNLPRSLSISLPVLNSFLEDGTELDTNIIKKTMPELVNMIVDNVEKKYICTVLRETKGRVNKAAEIAGIHSRGFYSKMKKFNISKEDYK